MNDELIKREKLIKRIDNAMTARPVEWPLYGLLADCRAALSQSQAEIKRLRQGLWYCYKAAGGDTDGDDTPDAVVTDIVPQVLDCVADLRECYNDALSRKYVPMTKQEAINLLGRCEHETEEQVFLTVREVEEEVIRRAGLEVENEQ